MVTRACNAISVGFEIGVLRKECIGWFSCNVSYVQVIIIICLYYTLPKPFTCSLPHPIRVKKQTYELTHPVTHPPRSRRILVILVYMLCYAIMGGLGFWGDPYVGLRVKCWWALRRRQYVQARQAWCEKLRMLTTKWQLAHHSCRLWENFGL